MADRVVPGPVESSAQVREAVCIQTRKIFDSCRDKDCIEDLRVFPTVSSQSYIESAISVRPKCAELLYADVKVEGMSFNRGYYTVDVTYFYRVTGETFPGGSPVSGLAVFDKRVMLFGSEGAVKTFTSADSCCHTDPSSPIGVVGVVAPAVPSVRMAGSECLLPPGLEARDIPGWILERFPEELVLTDTAKRLFVTLGQFSIIRLERDTQLLIPAYDYCLPDKECEASSPGDDPCALFGKIRFPVEEFFPPDTVECSEEYKNLI